MYAVVIESYGVLFWQKTCQMENTIVEHEKLRKKTMFHGDTVFIFAEYWTFTFEKFKPPATEMVCCVCVCVCCGQGICASIRNFNSRILQLDQESIKQMQIVYNQVTANFHGSCVRI